MFTLASDPSHGALTLDANGRYLYTPEQNHNGPDAFTFTLTDDETAGGPALTSREEIVAKGALDANSVDVVLAAEFAGGRADGFDLIGMGSVSIVPPAKRKA